METRKRRGKTKPLIKWKSFADSEATWEPADNVKEDLGLSQFVRYEAGPHRTVSSSLGNFKVHVIALQFKLLREAKVLEGRKLYDDITKTAATTLSPNEKKVCVSLD